MVTLNYGLQFVFVLPFILPVIYGYTCYKCSYTTDSDTRSCIEDPARLGRGSHLPCNSTSFCVLQEQYDTHQKKVTSYFRSCSGNSWGNECTRDWSHVTCWGSCQGNFCNEHDNGERYAEFLANHKDGHFNAASHVVVMWESVTYIVTSVTALWTLFS